MVAQCKRPSNILIVVAIMVDVSQIYEFLIFFLFLSRKILKVVRWKQLQRSKRDFQKRVSPILLIEGETGSFKNFLSAKLIRYNDALFSFSIDRSILRGYTGLSYINGGAEASKRMIVLSKTNFEIWRHCFRGN